jgi:hypothetical protein
MSAIGIRYSAFATAILLALIFGLSTLGEILYNRFLSEAALLLVLLAFLIRTLTTVRIVVLPWYVWLFAAYGGVYLAASFGLDRDTYYIVRQGVLMLYFLALPLTVAVTAGSPYRVERLYAGFVVIALFSLFAAVLWRHFYGIATNTSGMMLLVMEAYMLQKTRSLAAQVAIGVGFALSLLYLTLHSSHFLAALAVFVVYRVMLKPRESFAWLVLSVIGGWALFTYEPSFTDGNAFMRLVLWESYIERSWDHGYLLLGEGFGLQLVPEEHAWLVALQLVNKSRELDWMLMVTPPHNTFLLVLRYVGLPGLLLMLAPVFYIYRSLGERAVRQDDKLRVLVPAFSGSIVIGFFNQFLGAPYYSVPFFVLLGLIYAQVRIIKAQRADTSRLGVVD